MCESDQTRRLTDTTFGICSSRVITALSVGKSLEPRDYCAQCRQVPNFDADVHDGLHRFLVQVRLKFCDIGVLVGQYRTDIAQQPAPIHRSESQVDRISRCV
jgi:hypothetical protein